MWQTVLEIEWRSCVCPSVMQIQPVGINYAPSTPSTMVGKSSESVQRAMLSFLSREIGGFRHRTYWKHILTFPMAIHRPHCKPRAGTI